MNNLKAGFARVNITPMMGIPVSGYYIERYAEGVLDELEINALALSCGDDKVVMLSCDLAGIKQELSERYRKHIAEVCNIPFEAIYLHATHTHTGPATRFESERNGTGEKAIYGDKLVAEYCDMLYHKFADAAIISSSSSFAVIIITMTSFNPGSFLNSFRKVRPSTPGSIKSRITTSG